MDWVDRRARCYAEDSLLVLSEKCHSGEACLRIDLQTHEGLRLSRQGVAQISRNAATFAIAAGNDLIQAANRNVLSATGTADKRQYDCKPNCAIGEHNGLSSDKPGD